METTTDNNNHIQLENPVNAMYWAKKFGVSQRELYDGILYTGSLDARVVKQYLKRNSWLYHPIDLSAQFLKNAASYIF